MVPMFGTQSVTFWYPTSSPQFRTIVRPPTSPSLISYFSTTSQPLPTPIPNPKKEGRKEGGEGAGAPPRPSRLTRDDLAFMSHVLPTDRQTLPPAGRVAPIPRWNERAIKSSKAIGERAARRTSAPPRAPDLWKAINDDAAIRQWQLQCGSFCSYRDCYLMGQSRTLGLFGVRQLTQNFSYLVLFIFSVNYVNKHLIIIIINNNYK